MLRMYKLKKVVKIIEPLRNFRPEPRLIAQLEIWRVPPWPSLFQKSILLLENQVAFYRNFLIVILSLFLFTQAQPLQNIQEVCPKNQFFISHFQRHF